MRVVIKRIFKLLVKQLPLFRFRAALLRGCGYKLGADVYVGEDLIIIDDPTDWGLVSIGDRAAISPRVTLIVSSKPNFSRIAPYAPVKHGPVIIESDAWLGTGVVVLPNVIIGEGAIVGANSVVAQNVLPYTIVGGVPAHVIRNLPVPWHTP
jgi:acetyltransferase-like isoleucine patch superfamily enzyme